MINKVRLKQVQERMRRHGVDAYMVLSHDDFVYIFGEDRHQPRAIVPASGLPIVIAFRGEEDEVRRSLGVDDVRVFGTVGQQIRDVVEVMRELSTGRERIRVGVQMWFSTPAFLLNMFQKANPQVDVVDIAPVMDDLRAVKDEGELTLMQRASEIASIGMKAATAALRPGVTENDVAAEAEYAMRKAGGHGTATPVFVNSGVRSCWLHGTATDRRIDEGDLVVVDLVPRYNGYCANLCRTFVVGTPTPEQTCLFEAYREAQRTAIAVLRPGTAMRDVDTAVKASLERAGFGDYLVFGFSHGIGLNFEEKPVPTIRPGDSSVAVQEGMALTAGHSVLAVPGLGGVRIEDTFHITASGPVPLTDYPVGLATA